MEQCDWALHSVDGLCEGCERFLVQQETEYRPGTWSEGYRTLAWSHDALSTQKCVLAGCRLCCLIWYNAKLPEAEQSPHTLNNAMVRCDMFGTDEEHFTLRLSFQSRRGCDEPESLASQLGSSTDIEFVQLSGQYPRACMDASEDFVQATPCPKPYELLPSSVR